MTTKVIYKALYDDIRENGDRLINDKQIKIDDQNAVLFTHVALFENKDPDPIQPLSEMLKDSIKEFKEILKDPKPKKNYNQTAEVKESKKDAKK